MTIIVVFLLLFSFATVDISFSGELTSSDRKLFLSFLGLDASLSQALTPSGRQTLNEGTVKIISLDSTDQTQEEGAGIIVGKKDNLIFIITAYHVVKESKKRKVIFFKHKWKPFNGTLFSKYNQDLDIGVLVVNMDSNDIVNSLPQIQFIKPITFLELSPVLIVGHPYGSDWQLSQNKILSSTHEDSLQKFTITNTAIDRGSSGGPIFDMGLNIIGIITEKSYAKAVAVKFDTVLDLLKHWDIPTNLVKSDSNTTHPKNRGLRSTPMAVSRNDYIRLFNIDIFSGKPLKYTKNNFEDQGLVVLDRTTGLMWQKSGSGNGLTYEEAQDYVKELNREKLAGFDDWRLPTIPELLTLLKTRRKRGYRSLYIDPIFDKNLRNCLSADTVKGSEGLAWSVYFEFGMVHPDNTFNGSDCVRVVRTSKVIKSKHN